MILAPCRVVAEGVVDTDTIKLVDGTIRDRNCIDWPVVSKRKSTEAGGMTLVGSSLV